VSALAFLLTMLPAPLRAATNQLSCSPTSLTYGIVTVGQTETLLVAVTNNGQARVTISGVSSSNTKFTVAKLKLPLVLAAGASLEVSLTFAPTVPGLVTGQVTFVSNASNPILQLGLGGTGASSEDVTASPGSVSFGNVQVGGTATVPVVLTNTRTWSVTLASLKTIGSEFSVSGAKFPLTLAAKKSVKLNATFQPQVAGLTGGSFFISGPKLNVPLTGTGTSATKAQLTVTPATLNFGNVATGTTETLTAGLSASSGSLTVSSLSSSSSQFAVPGVSFPLTIPAGHEVSLNVTFTPKNNGKTSGTLSFVSNAANSLASEGLSGTGTAPYVSLSWSASKSEVTGYNIYRSTSQKGSYTKINSTLDPDTTYTDTTVVAGTYYYATTAVNSGGKESGYSNQVKVVVP